LRHRRKRRGEILDGLRRYHVERNSEFCAGHFSGLQGRSVRGLRGTKEHAEPCRVRHDLLQYLQPLGGEVGCQHRQTRDVSAGASETRHVPEADRVGMGCEHDGDRLGHLPDGPNLNRRRREYDVDVHADQLGCKLGQLVDRLRPPELNDNVLSFDIAEFAQAGPQRLDSASEISGGTKP
jgi:hypothetical protein